MKSSTFSNRNQSRIPWSDRVACCYLNTKWKRIGSRFCISANQVALGCPVLPGVAPLEVNFIDLRDLICIFPSCPLLSPPTAKPLKISKMMINVKWIPTQIFYSFSRNRLSVGCLISSEYLEAAGSAYDEGVQLHRARHGLDTNTLTSKQTRCIWWHLLVAIGQGYAISYPGGGSGQMMRLF